MLELHHQHTEFSFWDSSNTTNYNNFNNETLSYTKSFGTKWKKPNTRTDVNYDSSPLLSQHHHYSSLSPRSRTQAIEQGRRELMEMIKDMPESKYELSLKDIVDEQQEKENVEKRVDEDQTNLGSDVVEDLVKAQKMKMKKNVVKAGKLSRRVTMDNEFLIKMYRPRSFGSMKKEKGIKNKSKGSPTILCDRYVDSIVHQWWTMRKWMFFIAGKKKISSSKCINRSSSSSSDDNFSLGCWAFLHSKKNKNKEEKGRIFRREEEVKTARFKQQRSWRWCCNSFQQFSIRVL